MNIPNPADDWAKVELHRWQYGEIPQPNDLRPLNASKGLQKMADAIMDGCQNDATPEAREAMPSPFNVVMVMRHVAQLLEKENAPAVSIRKPGRNDPCTCGSGKKYKRCCAGVQGASDPLEKALREINAMTEGFADGAPDASSHDFLCNQISGIASEALYTLSAGGAE